MAFPTTGVLDNFNRSNEGPPPSASWSTPTGANGLEVVSNVCPADTSPGWGIWNPGTFGAASEAHCKANVAIADGKYLNLLVRGADTGALNTTDGYYAKAHESFGGKFYIYRLDNGASTQLGATVEQTVSAGDYIGIEAIGTAIKGYYKASGGSWAEIASRTSDTYSAAGYIGLAVYFGSADDFGGGTVVAAATGNPWYAYHQQ